MVYCRVFVWLFVYLTLVFAARPIKKECQKIKCPGPLLHYMALNCTPVYEGDGCCPVRYNCDHMYERSRNKCFLNGHEYEIGEKIRIEDAVFCEGDCICTNIDCDFADFNCTSLKCPKHDNARIDYCPYNHLGHCCLTEEICPNDSKEVESVCHADGKTFLPGDYFMPINNPDVICVCERNNIGSYSLSCAESNRLFNIHAAAAFYHRCAPLYSSYKDNTTLNKEIQNQAWACQSVNTTDRNPEEFNDIQQCAFGTWVMNITTEFYTYYEDNSELHCTCEVPPVPTCTYKTKLTDYEFFSLMRSGRNDYCGFHSAG